MKIAPPPECGCGPDADKKKCDIVKAARTVMVIAPPPAVCARRLLVSWNPSPSDAGAEVVQ